MFFFEEYGARSFYEPEYPANAWLIFGKETTGLPQTVLNCVEDRTFHMPMRSRHIRSLNLSNAVTAVAYQALRGQFTG